MPRGPLFTRENAAAMAAKGNEVRKANRERDKMTVEAARAILEGAATLKPAQPIQPPTAITTYQVVVSPRARMFRKRADELLDKLATTDDPKAAQALAAAASYMEELYCRHAGIAKAPTAKPQRTTRNARPEVHPITEADA